MNLLMFIQHVVQSWLFSSANLLLFLHDFQVFRIHKSGHLFLSFLTASPFLSSVIASVFLSSATAPMTFSFFEFMAAVCAALPAGLAFHF